MPQSKEKITDQALDNVQREWKENKAYHKKRRDTENGIRSSQVSATIAYLVDIGVINEDNVNDTNII